MEKSQFQSDVDSTLPGQNQYMFMLAAIGVFIAPILQSLSRVQIKKIKTITPVAMAAYQNVFLMVISAVYMSLPFTDPWHWDIPLKTYGYIVLISVLMVVAQLSRLLAGKQLTVSRMSIFGQLGLVL